MSPELLRQQEVQHPRFEYITLDTSNLSGPSISEDDGLEISRYENGQSVSIRQRSFGLSTKHDEFRTKHGLIQECDLFEITDPAQGFSYIEGQIIFTNDGQSAETSIHKSRPYHESGILTGVGTTLYEKMLDYLEREADRRNHPIEHTVKMHQRISATPLSEERWREIFCPILESRGYREEDEGTWMKTYYPENSSDIKLVA